MERITLQLEVAFTAIEGQQLTEQNHLIDKFTDYVYKYHTDKAQVQTVQVTKINGQTA